MTNSILEITENEYLIKLDRRNFDLSFIRSLLKMVEVSAPGDEAQFAPTGAHFTAARSSEPDYYSPIEEK